MAIVISDEINKAIIDLAKDSATISYQQIVNYAIQTIIDTGKGRLFNEVVSMWTRELKNVSCNSDIELIRSKPSWKNVEVEYMKKYTNGDNNNHSHHNNNISKKSPSSAVKKKSPRTATKSLTGLRIDITEEEKNTVQEIFNEMDKDNLWVLEATKAAAAATTKETGETYHIASVEEKMLRFALNCNFRHPSQSFILDLNDKHWNNVFTKAELKELEETGDDVLVPVDSTIVEKLNEMDELETAEEVYNYARTILHDPKEQPLLAWLTMTLLKTSYPFIHKAETNAYLETDKQYLLWGFINDIFTDSNIVVQGKEKTSQADAAQNNNKRKLSAVEEIQRKAIGRRMDAIYIGGFKELGCMEVGPIVDQTKELKDASIKMTIVMKDMLREIVETSRYLVRRVHIMGYMIIGEQVSILDMDSPKGYVSRIRHTKPIQYPSCSEDYVARISPLIELAVILKKKIEATLEIYQKTRIPVQVAKHNSFVLPPNPFLPCPSSKTTTPETITTETIESTTSEASSEGEPFSRVSKRRNN